MTIKSIMLSLGLRHLNAPIQSGQPSREPGREVEDELRFHVEMRTRDNIAAGMAHGEAVADAMRRFGDFDHVRTICEEIRKERLDGIMKVIKGATWVIIGCGLTLKMSSSVYALRDVGDFLILIALLWRLLIHLRQLQPDQQRIKATEQPALSLIHTIGDFSGSSPAEQSFKPVPAYDKAGRTPVERLLSDEE